ncbi:MAG: T9SS type A sorting domain-containing protein, partial [Saprospiraceae bacterium]
TKVAAAGIATIATLAKPINATSETFDLATLSSKSIEKPAFELNIYPNPVNEILSFQIKGLAKEQSLQVNIIDSKGAIVIEKNEKFSSNVSLTDVDVSKLAPGPYLLKIGSGQNAITSRFIIGK